LCSCFVFLTIFSSCLSFMFSFGMHCYLLFWSYCLRPHRGLRYLAPTHMARDITSTFLFQQGPLSPALQNCIQCTY
jgi:hypothetical protein